MKKILMLVFFCGSMIQAMEEDANKSSHRRSSVSDSSVESAIKSNLAQGMTNKSRAEQDAQLNRYNDQLAKESAQKSALTHIREILKEESVLVSVLTSHAIGILLVYMLYNYVEYHS